MATNDTVSLLDVVQHELTCPVCRDIFNQSDRMPKMLSCPAGHTICLECYEGLAAPRSSDTETIEALASDSGSDVEDIEGLASERGSDVEDIEGLAAARGSDDDTDEDDGNDEDDDRDEDYENYEYVDPTSLRCPLCRAGIEEMEELPNNLTVIALLDKADRQVTCMQDDRVSVAYV